MHRDRKNIFLLLGFFAVSRAIVYFMGVDFQYDALYKYWQYLDVDTLKHNLWKGIWYDPAQPPIFNLFLGTILKLFGDNAEPVFILIFKLVSLVNALLIYTITRRLTSSSRMPLIVALVYVLSPASMIFENELFYTSFITLLLLTSASYLLQPRESINWKRAIGIMLPLLLITLSRSMYHLAWLIVIAAGILFFFRRYKGLGKLAFAAIISVLILGGWYLKNALIFGKFTTSTWIGMNLSRNVFHDAVVDSNSIEAIEPFSTISTYRPFITGIYEKKFAGLNDKDLLQEFKNNSDTLINLNHISYIEVSDAYMAASKRQIRAQPVAYLKNVAQSAIIFFSPATRYPLAEAQARKIAWYDVLYSFNLSHFAKGQHQKRVALTLSAIPKALLYLLVFFFLLRDIIRQRRLGAFHFFVLATVGYVFVVSSLVEHYENMRFRYEVEPFFLILLGVLVQRYLLNRQDTKTQ